MVLGNSYNSCQDLSAPITLPVFCDVRSIPEWRWRFGKEGGDARDLRCFQFATGKSFLHPAPCPSFGSKMSSKRSKHPLLPVALFALSARQDPPLTSSQIPSLSAELRVLLQMRFKLWLPFFNQLWTPKRFFIFYILYFKQSLSLSGYYWDESFYCWTTANRWITSDVLLRCAVTLLSLSSASLPFACIVFPGYDIYTGTLTIITFFWFPFTVCVWEETQIEAGELEKDFDMTDRHCAKDLTT